VPGPGSRYEFDPEIKALLVVAGLSGCGKSTFIRQLRRRRIPSDIARLLPADVHAWQHIFGKKSWKDRLLRRQRAKPCGQIFHFDMTTSTAYRLALSRAGLSDCERPSEQHPDEQALNAVLASAEEIRILVVKPQKEQLVHQLSGRAAVTDLPPALRPLASRAARLLRQSKRHIPSQKRRTIRRFFGRGWARRSAARNQSYKNCEFYSRDGAIDAVHATWESSICRRIGNRLIEPTAYIEPAPHRFASRKFRPLQTSRCAPTHKYANQGSLTRLQELAGLLDDAVAIPGTRFSLGLDALLGIVPIVGDVISGTIAGFIIWRARRLGAPRRMLARMIANSAVDTLIGCIPIVGDIFDASYKSNVHNVAMLRRHLSGMNLIGAPA
jgi:hypothetical protein